MKSAWLSFANQLNIPHPSADNIWQVIESHHQESHRGYHNLDHLQAMFEAAENIVDGELPTAVSLATWFHDIIYDPQSQTNEVDSAVLMENLLCDCLDASLVEEVSRLIKLTKTHQLEDPADSNGRILLDADLSILGTPPVQYQAYANAIRQEYAHVPDELYRQGRTAVLNHFLQMETIFLTGYGRQHWEPQARQNLEFELSELA